MERTFQLDRDLIIIDVETTGVSIENSSIIQLGATAFSRNGKHIKDYEFSRFVKPYKDEWNLQAYTVHKIDRSFLLEKGRDILETLTEFNFWISQIGKPYTVYLSQWSASFDSTMLELAYKYCGLKYPFSHRVYDVASFVRLYLASRGGLDKIKIGLADCCEIFGVKIDNDKCHDALYDATITAKLLEKVISEIQTLELDKKDPTAVGNR